MGIKKESCTGGVEMKIKRKQKKNGFTMVEILVVVAIIGILSSLVTWNVSNSIKRAREAQLKVMMRNLADDLLSYAPEYDLKHRWGKNYDERYLNGKLEKLWENKPFDNVFNHKNPFSFSKVVLNWRSVPGYLKNPAIFITNNRRYSYDRIPPNRVMKRLKGSLVVWMRNKYSRVEVYYVNMDGKKSHYKISGE
ncbi:MAG TPA: type II secretion system protein [candidate division WOR-3 bacterium]|uniref:Type II secretion system protein n=1 Tax=candidate division WOR-3 bacterium TaxID=2052148 RepID=A0A9C9EL27_UNCW3|nr:type II secretion system protein [candidate division WOR-3 bacterium]